MFCDLCDKYDTAAIHDRDGLCSECRDSSDRGGNIIGGGIVGGLLGGPVGIVAGGIIGSMLNGPRRRR